MAGSFSSTLHHQRQGNSGPVLLLVHGFPMSHLQWKHQLDEFSKTCRVIAPDLRGLGMSPLRQGQTTLSIEDHADDLVELLESLQITEPVVLMGLSMGGYIAWQMVKKYPHRLRALVLCHTRVIADTPEQAAGRHQLAQRTVETRSAEPVLETMLPRLLPPSVQPSVADAVRIMARQTTPEGLAANLHALATRIDATSLLSTIQVPSLVISGELDAISPLAEMSQWASLIPHAEFISLPGVGHVSPLEAPELFNRTVHEKALW